MTPLYEALLRQLELGRARLHMPGHKGALLAPLSECAPFDLTELPLTGCLTDGEGPPVETERLFSRFYGSGATLLSAGGATLCIQAMLALFCPGGSKVLMGRSSHLAAVNAAALLSLEPVWLWPDEPSGVGTPGRVSPAAIKEALEAHPDCSAVYLTSPDYFGSLCDVEAISSLCRRAGRPLLIDNAHGAHLGLFGQLHPLALGADACCDSLHKTLPALTGAALLHLRDGALAAEARRRMSTFGSTSPSYLIMLSADLLTERLVALQDDWRGLAGRTAPLIEAARRRGVWATVGASDPTRLTLLFPEGEREQALALLGEGSIEAEYVSQRHIILLCAPQSDLAPIAALIERLPPLREPPALPSRVRAPRVRLPLRQAALAPAIRLPLLQAAGRVAAAPLTSCPPGLALIMPGEVVEPFFLPKNCGVTHCFVVQ